MEPGYIDINIHKDMIMCKDEYINYLEQQIETLKQKMQALEGLLSVDHHYGNRYD